MEYNTRHKIADIPVDGVIVEIGELTSWGDQDGKLRNLVVEVDGIFGPAMVPLAVFGDDAAYLDPTRDVGRRATCTGRLTARRYTDHNGKERWSMSLTARGFMLTSAAPNAGAAPTGEKDAAEKDNSLAGDIDELPF